MRPSSCNANLASTLIAACNDLTAVHAALSCLVARLVDGATKGTEPAFEQPLKHGVEQPVKSRDEIHAAHRRAHRSGRPGKIDSDHELQAFILVRIDALTFAQIVSKVRAAFPPDRRCSISGLGRCWQKRRGTPQPAITSTDAQQPQVTAKS